MRGIALPIALILVAVVLVVAVALSRNVGTEARVVGSEADRTFATEATDAALRSTMAEIKTLPVVPQLIDANDPTMKWWNASASPITANFWKTCATGAPGNRCAKETKTQAETNTQAGRTYDIFRVVQPTGTVEEIGATSGSYVFFYRVSVLITLDSGARSEVEAYVRRPQLIKS